MQKSKLQIKIQIEGGTLFVPAGIFSIFTFALNLGYFTNNGNSIARYNQRSKWKSKITDQKINITMRGLLDIVSAPFIIFYICFASLISNF